MKILWSIIGGALSIPLAIAIGLVDVDEVGTAILLVAATVLPITLVEAIRSPKENP